ncbi:MAG TPA: STAS/SEC14 domain-containing protein [Hanamia sp.]|nr:STAS/SEC14 domain-containing protein [Hanamia sp.]
MIEIIQGLPSNVAAFNATGKITGKDYDEIINPLVKNIYLEFGKINYLLVLNTPLDQYNIEAWLKDAILGFVYFTEWKKIGIVTNKPGIKNFTNIFGRLLPGSTRGFLMEDLDIAKQWIAE